MHSPPADEGLEVPYGLPSIDEFESLFPNTGNSSTFTEKTDNESTCKVTTFVAASKQDDVADLFIDSGFHKIDPTTPGAPLSSKSNPETPKAQFEFALEDFAPTMTRIFSEQSGLATLNPPHHPENVHQPLLRNTQQRGQLSNTMRRSNSSHGWAQDAAAMASFTADSVPNATITYHQHQAGLDFGAQNVRPLHVRTPLRPSSLRNTLSSANIYQPISEGVEPNPHFTQSVAGNSNHHENARRNRERRHTDAQYFPRNQVAGPYTFFKPNQLYGGFAEEVTNHASPAQLYSLPIESPQVYHRQEMNRDLTQPDADSYRSVSGMLVQQPTNNSTYLTRPLQYSAFGQRTHTMSKRDIPRSVPAPQGFHFQPVEETDSSKGPRNQNPNENVSATIAGEDSDKKYFDKILAAMYDTSRAQDNAGMISTWKTQMNDKEAVEGVARDLLETCKRRESRGRTFRKGLKPTHRFQTFDERFDALVEALTTQKTMCKHLLRQPYIEEIVDDPLGSIARITNNRKVNRGKKLAIEKGREALGQEGRLRRFTKISSHGETEDDDQDAENESFDEDQYDTLIKRSSTVLPSISPGGDRRDSSHCEGPAPKRAKRASRSKYQLNERNEMIDTSESPNEFDKHHLRSKNDMVSGSKGQKDEHRLQQQSSRATPHPMQNYDSVGAMGSSPQSASNPQFSLTEQTGIQYGDHQQASTSRTRRHVRR